MSLTGFILAVSKTHQTDGITGRAVNLVSDTELNTINPDITNSNDILGEGTGGSTAVAERSVEGWRLCDDVVG